MFIFQTKVLSEVLTSNLNRRTAQEGAAACRTATDPEQKEKGRLIPSIFQLSWKRESSTAFVGFV